MKREKKQMVDFEAFEIICEERDTLQRALKLASADVSKLTAELQKTTQDQQELLDLQRADYEKAINERDALRKELETAKKMNQDIAEHRDLRGNKIEELAECLRAAEAKLNLKCMELTSAKDQIAAQVEVIERLKTQNSNFCEEQREAKQRADATAASLIRAKDEVARLVSLNNDFKDQLVAFKREAAAVTDQLRVCQADYDARGRVIKKLRKRLHKLKKKLKH